MSASFLLSPAISSSRERRVMLFPRHKHGTRLIAGMIMLATLGCRFQSPPEVKFVIPNGFYGPIIVMNDKNGARLLRRDGAYIIDVPESGVVKIRSVSIFEQMTAQSATYADGQRIPFDYGVMDDPKVAVSDDKIALRPCGRKDYDWGSVFRFYVGNKEDADRCDFSEITW